VGVGTAGAAVLETLAVEGRVLKLELLLLLEMEPRRVMFGPAEGPDDEMLPRRVLVGG
jgi:hypothetical protein